MIHLIVGAFVISWAPIFVKIIHGVGPAAIGAWRTFFAGLVLIPFAASFFKKRHPIPRPWFIWVLLAGVAFAFDLSLWHFSIQNIGAGMATILASTQVYYMAGFSLYLREQRLDLRFIFAVALAFLGVVIIAGATFGALGEAGVAGTVTGLVAGFFYSVYLISMRKAASVDSKISTATTLCFVSLTSSASMFFMSSIHHEEMRLSAENIINLFGLGAAVHVLGWLLISSGLRTVRSSLSGLTLLLQPLLATMLAALLFGEVLSSRQLLGASLTLLGIGLESFRAKKQPRPQSS